MLNVHKLSKFHSKEKSPIEHVGHSLSSTTNTLFLDEMQVTDIADAMVLKRLFHSMWKGGVFTVATSNRPPEDLYKNGLQRSLFLPFISDLNVKNNVVFMEGKDWRQRGDIS